MVVVRMVVEVVEVVVVVEALVEFVEVVVAL